MISLNPVAFLHPVTQLAACRNVDTAAGSYPELFAPRYGPWIRRDACGMWRPWLVAGSGGTQCLGGRQPADVFGRAYGLAIPASIGGIVVGSLIAPVLVSAAGLSGALAISGAVAVGYGLQLLAGQRHAAPVAPQATPVSVA